VAVIIPFPVTVSPSQESKPISLTIELPADQILYLAQAAEALECARRYAN
jgi:hypothetical protein